VILTDRKCFENNCYNRFDLKMKHQIHHKEAKRSATTEKAQSDKHGVRLPKWELIVILVLML